MRRIVKTTNNKFLNIFEVYDEDKHCRGYQYAERRGVNSVAFICYDKKNNRFLLNSEFTPPNDLFMTRAFGGSLDKDDKDCFGIVLEEVEEEAGYKVNKADVEYLGHCFVSTQMNQCCHLFLVFVDDSLKTERKPENKMEAAAVPIWLTKSEIYENDDWKAITIITKAIHQQLI